MPVFFNTVSVFFLLFCSFLSQIVEEPKKVANKKDEVFRKREEEIRKKGVYFHTFSKRKERLTREEANSLIDKSMNTLVGREEILKPADAEKAFLELFEK